MSKTTLVGQPSAPPGPPPIPNHTLLYRIGAGSYGEVWLARDLLGTLRAVKIVHRHNFDSDRPYEREFAGLQKFEPISRRHESQLDILHVGRDDAFGCFYYVMELADDAGAVGEKVSEPVSENQAHVGTHSPAHSLTRSLYSPRTLRSELLRRGRLPPAECVRLGLALATALEHLHSHGLVHRDIKPSNIVFVEGQPKLADIGLVTDVDATMSFVGTEGYFPPEGPGQPAADLFSLGKVLYEISTGRDRKEFPALPQNFADLPDAEKEELREFNAVVLQACQPLLSYRYATAVALRKELELLQAGLSVRQHHTLQRQLARLKTWVLPAAAVAIVGTVVWAVWSQNQHERRWRQAQSILREVQMIRQTDRTNGWFDGCWKNLQDVARLKVDDDARTQAAACLSGLDAKLVHADTNSGAFSLAFSPDGQTLLCAGVTDRSGRQPARLWRLPISRSSRREAHSSLGRDQSLLTSAATNQERTLSPLPVTGDAVAAWRSDGASNGTPVLFLPGPTNRFVLVKARTSNVLQEFILEGNPYQGNESHPVLALSSNAHFAAASVTLADSPDSLSPAEGERAGVRGNPTPVLKGHFAVWDAASGRRLFQTNETASALAFSPDGCALAVGDSAGRVRVFSAPDFALLAEFPGARVRINCFAFTRDPIVPRGGPLSNAWWLAVGDAGGTICIWRTATRELLSTCRGSAYDVFTMAFHPDGVTLASAGRTEVRFWDAVHGGEPILRMPNQLRENLIPDFVRGITFTPDGSRFAFAREQQYNQMPFVSLWELEPQRGVQMLHGLDSRITRVWFSPDGRWLAALAGNWQLALWELPSGRLRRVFETPQGDTADNAGVAFHPDGKQLAFSAGRQAVLWNLSNGNSNRSWFLPSGYSDDLAFDREAKLWLIRRESPDERELPRHWSWLLRELDASPTGRIHLSQQDAQDWHPNELAVVPKAGCFLAAGWGSNITGRFGRIACFSQADGALLWSNQQTSEIRMAIEPQGEFVAHYEQDRLRLRRLPGGTPVEPPIRYLAFSWIARLTANFLPTGCAVCFGLETNAPAIALSADFRGSSGNPVFSRRGEWLAWGTENGFVLVAELAKVRQRMKKISLDVDAPGAARVDDAGH